jgi:putative redox protein
MTESSRENLRSIELTRIGEGRYKATNQRGGVLPIGSGDDPDFTPVELLLAAIAGCGAIDVDLITGKRAPADSFDVRAEGTKVRDEHGNRLTDLRVTFDLSFPPGEAGDAARGVLQDAINKSGGDGDGSGHFTEVIVTGFFGAPSPGPMPFSSPIPAAPISLTTLSPAASMCPSTV